MAKIDTNDLAPQDAKHFSLANADFDVPFDTDDPVVIANAIVHPWLDVDFGDRAEVEVQFIDRQVRPEDDPFTFAGRTIDPNDPAEVRKALEAREDLTTKPLAVESGLDQSKAETVGEGDHEVAITLAADDTDSTTTKSRSSARKEK